MSSPAPASQPTPLQPLLVDTDRAEALKIESIDLPSLTLSQRQLCDLELLMNGGFTPLKGFMTEAEYRSVIEDMRLADGSLWPIPVTLDIPDQLAAKLAPGERIALRDNEGFMLAVLAVESLFKPDPRHEARRVYGTESARHPGVAHLLRERHETLVGGVVDGIQLPTHYDYEELRHTPSELRGLLAKLGWRRVMAFHTSRPMHRLQRDLTIEAAKQANAHILLHPVVGIAKPRDLSYFARVKCYQAVLGHYPHGLAALSLLPLAMRAAGPREALWHAIIRRNYGCTHLLVGADHASPHGDAGENFYPGYAAQELLAEHQDAIGIRMVAVRRKCYVPARAQILDVELAEQRRLKTEGLSDAELGRRLVHNDEIPEWFSYPEVIEALRRVYPPRHRQGLTLFFTGLSGAGKSTLAKIMHGKFIEDGRRPVTLLDGDIVRQHLSSELGFSRAHRDLNVKRIGFVASEITKNGGVAICAPIAPYAETRDTVREMIEAHGAMIEIHVATPLEVCEARDRKGLYAKARQGIIPAFTGISDPYEIPEHPELRIDTSEFSPMEAAQEVFLYLLREGYLDPA